MMGISLFALGGLSTIYYRAAYQVLRIDGEFEGAFARMIVSRMALWQLKEEYEKDPTDSKLGAAVDISRINKVLSDAYELDLQMGDLTKHDVHQMARLMMTSMDFSRDGLVELSEFLQATSSNESVRAQDIIHFFDARRKHCSLECFFDDTRTDRTVKDEDGNNYDPQYVAARGKKALFFLSPS